MAKMSGSFRGRLCLFLEMRGYCENGLCMRQPRISGLILASKASFVVSGLHSRVPAFLRETPHDTGVTRSVKRAYSTVDTLR